MNPPSFWDQFNPDFGLKKKKTATGYPPEAAVLQSSWTFKLQKKCKKYLSKYKYLINIFQTWRHNNAK